MKNEMNESDFIINTPYDLTYEDIEAIQKASHGIPHQDQWDKSCLRIFRDHIRDYYQYQQNFRCVYCRNVVHLRTCPWHIEHIVPKSKKPQWMYEPFNLCLACPDCNSSKLASDVLRDSNENILPRNSEAYLIVHPHLDYYFEHIEIIDDILYKGLTPKGIFTIKICKLNTAKRVSDRALDLYVSTHGRFTMNYLLLLLSMHPECVEEMNDLLEKVTDIMSKIKK